MRFRIITFFLLLVQGYAQLFEGTTTGVVELDGSIFRTQIEDDKSDVKWAVMFYASWCGHCQQFAPIFTRIAESHRHQSVVKFAAMDCATPARYKLGDEDLCRKADVKAYPTILVFQNGTRQQELAKVGDALEKEIANLVGVEVPSPSIGESETEDEETALKAPDVQDSNSFVVNSETLNYDAALAMHTIFHDSVFKGAETSIDELEDVIQLVSICARSLMPFDVRDSCRELQAMLEEKRDAGSALTHSEWIGQVELHMGDLHDRTFVSCKDFSCGMWRLLHLVTLSAEALSVPDPLSPKQAMEAVRFIVDKFFSCTVCRDHFLSHYDNCDFDRCSITFDYTSVANWLIRLHNGVNRRLGRTLWPDSLAAAKSPTELVNSLRTMYGLPERLLWSVPPSLWLILIGFSVMLFGACWRYVGVTTIDRVKSQVAKKYQPLNIV
jgi:thiol-disulfide isomerase/thioredoxin